METWAVCLYQHTTEKKKAYLKVLAIHLVKKKKKKKEFVLSFSFLKEEQGQM